MEGIGIENMAILLLLYADDVFCLKEILLLVKRNRLKATKLPHSVGRTVHIVSRKGYNWKVSLLHIEVR